MVVAYQLFRNTWYTAACGRSRQTAQHRIPPSLCSSFSDSSPSVMVLRFLGDGPSSACTYSGKGLLLEDAKESAAGASAILLCANKNTNKKITNKTKQKTYKLSKYTYLSNYAILSSTLCHCHYRTRSIDKPTTKTFFCCFKKLLLLVPIILLYYTIGLSQNFSLAARKILIRI